MTYTFFMVFVEGSRGCTYQHRTMQEAQAEAERLARMEVNIGRNVFVLSAVACAKVEPAPVLWTDVSGNIAPKPDEIPF